MSGESPGSSEPETLSALHRLGFGTTEAEVLVGLHRLGAGTAREVSRVTDVARPQVYSAVEGLEKRGLVNVQQANPKRFRPVSPEETADHLRRSFESDIELVADHLEAVAAQRTGPDEEREDVWTLRGREAISERVVQMIEEATTRVVFGVMDETLLTDETVRVLRDTASRDVDVTVLSPAAAIRERFADDDGITAIDPPEHLTEHDRMGRLLLVDRETVLHSMLGSEELPGLRRETAFWSDGSGFASTFVAMVDHFLSEQHADSQ